MAQQLDLVVHSTHEAGVKLGGIGAVLDGLLSQPAYNAAVKRTVLVGPLNTADDLEMTRLFAPQNHFQPLYLTWRYLNDASPELAQQFNQVERDYHVHIVYGKKKYGAYEHEVLLIDPHHINPASVRETKYFFAEQYGIDSLRYQHDDEYNWYITAAAPSFAALGALVNWQPGRAVIIAHEWLGLPMVFAAIHRQPGAYKTVFYAHEVATMRPLVEGDRGHDTRFYNVMRQARSENLYVTDLFGDQGWNYRHAMIHAAGAFDAFLAVSDLTLQELQFLGPQFASRPISRVYNGVPAPNLNIDQRWVSKDKLAEYARALVGFRPTWVFSHVTRMVLSKALWRDLRVMEQLDNLLAARGESAVLFTLSSTVPQGRASEDVWRWEREYGWPAWHRSGNGDLVGLEVDYWQALFGFNQRARASRIVLVNQFGWSRERCGGRMPADMEYNDMRRGSDVEFGQSIYEPFGIAQLEPLSAGALCCLSTSCGCAYFLERTMLDEKSNGLDLNNIVLADYITLPPGWEYPNAYAMRNIGSFERDQIEAAEAWRAANKIIQRLPRQGHDAWVLQENGRALAEKMSWKVIVEEELVPALHSLF
ncbi:MAG: hypothetical protein HY741_28580 [Chloroflexi bacterium]|nr:hypothetical protein [Chloroflexota bacterium]